jgi:hypothetical protein
VTRRPAVLALAVATMVALVACGGDNGPKPIALDGTPRYPDAQGVVDRVSVTSITLDGHRTYKVSKKLQSFSTSTLQTLPLLQRKGQYVQVGLDGDTMVWIANVGAILPVEPPAVYYQGRLLRTDAQRRLVFRDGTVLPLAPGVTSPVPTGFVRADIDPAAHVVRGVVEP